MARQPWRQHRRLRRALSVLVVATLVSLTSGCGPYSRLYALVLSLERELAGLKPRSISVDGASYAYLERTGRGETLVLLHGFAADKDNWVRFVGHLPRRYHVIALDLPGHGESVFVETSRYDADSMTLEVAAVLEALGLEQFHLAGNSLGGWVATLYAAQHAERVLSLTLIDAAGVIPPQPSELQKQLLEGKNPLLVKSEADFDRLLEFVFVEEPFLPWPFRPELARVYEERAEVNEKIWDDLSEEMNDVAPELSRIEMPVLLLWGEEDRVLHVSSIEVYAEHLEDWRAVVLAETGHAPMAERPAESAKLVAAFLKGKLAAGRRFRRAPLNINPLRGIER